MTAITAPQTMTRREAVGSLLTSLPAERVHVVCVTFADESLPTTSFIDELIFQLLVIDRTELVELQNADDYTCELALAAADRYDVRNRLTCG